MAKLMRSEGGSMRRMVCVCLLWAVLGAWICPKAEAASSESCGNCTFHISDEGLLSREGSCGDSCTSLSLGFCNIQNITNGIFDGLSSLGRLDLYNNKLESLPGGVFDGLSSLQTLSLSNNKLESLPGGIFDGLSSLQGLGLSNNKLESLPGGVFDGLSSLGRLDLYNNKLESLPGGVFDGLSSLGRLDISNNNITCISSQAFTNLSSLSKMDLTGNNLPCYHPSWPSFASKDTNLESCRNEGACTQSIPLHSRPGREFGSCTAHKELDPEELSQYLFVRSVYVKCRMQHTWGEIVHGLYARNTSFKIGGLGKRRIGGKHEVWVCSYRDDCAKHNNAFCYIFDFEKTAFIPW